MNTTIAITISPPHRPLRNKMIEPYNLLFTEDSANINSIFRYSRIKTYLIYPELDHKGRLHYHGIINLGVNEYIRFYKHSIHKLSQIGYVDVKKINSFIDNLRWVIYMSKEWGITKDILSINEPIMKHKTTKIKSYKGINYFDSDKESSIYYYFPVIGRGEENVD